MTSPQAFEGLRTAGRKVRRPDLTLAVPDHNLPTTARVDAAAQAIEIEGRFNDVYPELLAGMSGTVHFSTLK